MDEFTTIKLLPYYNKKYTHEVESVYKKLSKEKELDIIFTKRERRKVKKDNTISFYGDIIQLPPSQVSLSYTKPYIEIRYNEKGDLYVLYKDKVILKTKISINIREAELEKFEKVMSKRIIA